ncbi:autotransporter outer membrane beta-barrel domain-containing protein [Campylobacter jejuni]|uniref:Autotransporter outer membrane beta-barrel domain-containing protein n=1 Tax=Campylobacter jejuni TaxID=197 RepID=A0AAN3QUA4_CAMJU|nr:autotransporter outer membrane beta-barrel domain-containing protein [Campylobacter jejuni]EAK0358448.1 autotransporter outer membrane beta-barrel domain-containing protein [Campylobacter jejuni]EAK3224578.1 autotransporter outer membrane beta-barrel domain-containing protein [Campylobacter jejuni]EAK3496005.1 autotransporter outer membrane beta-barrel domain-containing protein [Campylobacter jejuni]EAL5361978.1 autotransporter outer membrane beta-barrel domain-containing protein [Campylobac
MKKNHSHSSSKLVLSLAAISFLSSYSYATADVKAYSDNDNNSISVYQNTNSTINESLSSTHTVSNAGNTLVIGSNGTIQVSNGLAVDFQKDSSTTTFKNQGTLIGGSNTSSVQVGANGNSGGSATIETFKNEGIIGNGSSKFGVVVWGTSNSKSSITNFNNSGTISSNSGEAIYLGNAEIETFNNSGTISSNNDKGVNIKDGVTIETFNNIGTISSTGSVSDQGYKSGSVNIIGSENSNTTIKTFTNSGIISSENIHGVNLRYTTIDNFKNSGTIKTNGTQARESAAFSDSGFRMTYAHVKTFENTGTISGFMGVVLNGSTIDQFTNSGTIMATQNDNSSAGIMIGAINPKGEAGISTIQTLTNEGVITSKGQGIVISNNNNTIKTLINKGTIEASKNGIMFHNYDDTNGPTNLGTIIIESGGIIKAGNDAIHIDGSKDDITGEGINVQGRLEGGNAGIYIGGGKQVKTSITVSGTIQGGNGGIINTGTIGQEGVTNQTHGITIENGGLITSTNGSGILNTDNGIIYGNIVNKSNNDLTLKNDSSATITSGVTNSGNGTIYVNNQGTISKDSSGNNLTNNGSGSIVIEDWLVTTDKNTGKLDTIVVGGSHKDNVSADNITIDESNLDLDNLDDISDVISGIDKGNVSNITTNGSGGIDLVYDPTTGKIYQRFNLNASISGATFRSLISTTTRRSTFIDNVMGNSMQNFYLGSSSRAQRMAMQEKGNLYADASDYIKNDFSNASYGINKEHSLFILPYASSQNVELSLNEESKGHTKGTIIGYSTLKDSGIYGVYAGYEDTKMGSTYFDINNRTYYAGLKYFNTLFTTEKGQEVYIKAQGKTALIKNDLTKKIGTNEAKAEPNSYAYGINSDIGMNFISDKDIFSPEVGLVYEGGYTEAFSMQDTIGQATVKGGEKTYANYLNLFSTKTSFSWFRDWLPNFKTSLTLGAKFNINPSVKAKARFGSIKVNDTFDLPRVQEYITSSFIIPVNEAFYFSLNYNGMFDKDGDTHTGFAQFNYLW